MRLLSRRYASRCEPNAHYYQLQIQPQNNKKGSQRDAQRRDKSPANYYFKLFENNLTNKIKIIKKDQQ